MGCGLVSEGSHRLGENLIRLGLDSVWNHSQPHPQWVFCKYLLSVKSAKFCYRLFSSTHLSSGFGAGDVRVKFAYTIPATILVAAREALHMKSSTLVGVVLLVLGLLAFVVPIPQREDHSVKIGDAKIGVQTQSSQKLPAAVGIVLVGGGVLALVLGSRKR